MATIHVRQDRIRGCGWRQSGGYYLIADGPMASCGRLPLPLSTCHTCGQGIKQSRGWTWLTMPVALIHEEPRHCELSHCDVCPINPVRDEERMGLLWCGEKFYSTPQSWIREAREQGISRRISQHIPRGLIVGQTWVLMAHGKAVLGVDGTGNITYAPGIIQAFKPSLLEYVVRGTESEEELDALEKRGITCAQIERVSEKQEMKLL